ncbi:O-phosphoserine--tRNA ligase [Candidatus Bathyarchaeota archaeon]|nr:MAG: O-phosphoserine--tRNA ligase [Candidatus Bathyarchaeota archaeon ex4484_40]RJS78736.1 MAG: O-phosphoserine--tRNA ligase [Candidatus Bathyarchaeota archaeon]
MGIRLNPEEILKRVEVEGFEKVWRESGSFLPKPPEGYRLSLRGRGTPHPLFDLIEKMRRTFLNQGFIEVANPIIVEDTEVYKQYGPEAPVILDRCYYLAVLPRPDIGLSREKRREIESLGVEMTEEKTSNLKAVLRDYKRGKIEADDLIEKISESLEVPDATATLIVSKVFPEFTSLRPEPTNLTLRSHMTTSWFLSLQALQHRVEMPIKLFSVGIRFRREQREDPTHLRVHHAASCVVMDEAIDIKEGERITRNLLEPLGFKSFRFTKKKVTSKYYTPGTEYEGYIYHPKMRRWIEVVNFGLYNPIALARYGLEYPVLNVGVGVERVALALYGEDDVRRLVYPQFYGEWRLTDAEIARMISYQNEPKTREGHEIKRRIVEEALKHADDPSPCEVLAYEGQLLDKVVRVYLYEKERGARLLGAAARNAIYVHEGNVLGIPLEGMDHIPAVREAREKGVSTGLTYIEGVAALAASKIEEAAKTGRSHMDIRVRIARRPSDVNIKISNVARRYITSRKGRIDVSGPVFVGVRAEIMDKCT